VDALIGRGVEGVQDDDAALHCEFDLAEDGDVCEGIAQNGDEVGPSRRRINPSRLRVNELAVLEGAASCGSGSDCVAPTVLQSMPLP